MLDVAAALAVSREGASDWSPEALLWLHAQDDAHADLIRQRLTQYTLYTAARAAIQVKPEALAAAVCDAMGLVRNPKKRDKPNRDELTPEQVRILAKRERCPTLAERALQCQMRKADFGFMRATAERLLLTVIRRGVVRYLRACGYALRYERREAVERLAA